jgi:plasmid maintenance system antidote protein VapI
MTVCLRVFMCVSADGSCDASEAPEHGDVGDCPQQIQSNSTCQPTCDTGYVVSGVSRCENGVLIAANCTRSNSTSAWTSSTSSSPSLLFNSTDVPVRYAALCEVTLTGESIDSFLRLQQIALVDAFEYAHADAGIQVSATVASITTIVAESSARRLLQNTTNITSDLAVQLELCTDANLSVVISVMEDDSFEAAVQASLEQSQVDLAVIISEPYESDIVCPSTSSSSVYTSSSSDTSFGSDTSTASANSSSTPSSTLLTNTTYWLSNSTTSSTLFSCDASLAPENGDVGDCTTYLLTGTSCQPTCATGYTVSGPSSCEAGVLTSATCTGK